jgi:hypothetical protein
MRRSEWTRVLVQVYLTIAVLQVVAGRFDSSDERPDATFRCPCYPGQQFASRLFARVDIGYPLA